MLIDWFTVGAQALNFIILVWLLKRFLYKPIRNAVDAREKRIAAELADADAKRIEAKKAEMSMQHKNEELDQQRAALLSKATDEAKAERQRLLDDARKAADALSAKRQQELRSDAEQPGSSHPAPDRTGSVRDRAKGTDGSCHDKSGRAHERGFHPSSAHDGRQGQRGSRPGSYDGI